MYKCSYCQKECKNSNSLRNHERLCTLNPLYAKVQFICTFCGRRSVSKNGNTRHEKLCSKNPHRENCVSPWNKGLTKETSESLRAHSKLLSERIASGEVIGAAGRKGDDNVSRRPEVRAKVSAKMLGNSNNNPNKTGKGKKGWYKGFFCSSTYELAFVIYCLDHNIAIKRFEGYYNYEFGGKNHRYYPDFIINDCIYEIKGYHTEQVTAKTLAVQDRPIKVLYREDLAEVFEYILNTYDKQVDKNIHELYE